jgi:conjugal transfer/entry exclusion protein
MFSQGLATLSNALGERGYVEREVNRLDAWLTQQFPEAAAVPLENR